MIINYSVINNFEIYNSKMSQNDKSKQTDQPMADATKKEVPHKGKKDPKAPKEEELVS